MSNLNVISRKEIFKQIGVSRDTLKNWVKKRNFPEPLKSLGRDSLFDQLSVKEWLLNEGGNMNDFYIISFSNQNKIREGHNIFDAQLVAKLWGWKVFPANP